MWNIEAPEGKDNQSPQREISLSQCPGLPQLSQFRKEALQVIQQVVGHKGWRNDMAGLGHRRLRSTDCAFSSAFFCVWETVHNPHYVLWINIRCQGQVDKKKKKGKPNSLQNPLAFCLNLPESCWGAHSVGVWTPIPIVNSSIVVEVVKCTKEFI